MIAAGRGSSEATTKKTCKKQAGKKTNVYAKKILVKKMKVGHGGRSRENLIVIN